MNDDLKSLYRETLLRHSRNPSNRIDLPNATAEAELKNPLCGDLITIRLVANSERIEQAAFEAQCCSICMASASMLTETVTNQATPDARKFALSLIDSLQDSDVQLDLSENDDLNALAGVKSFPSRIRCATLPWEAMLAALSAEA